jgi:UDP-GlcNAc:undecaprenyl-phosphate GlcNAc-1-phosphate transferase
MPLGFLIAAMIMAAPGTETTGTEVLLAMALFAALPILDTTLVVFSRMRRGVPVMQGGRDHLTHRLHESLGSYHAVALVLAVSQIALCALGIALFKAGPTAIVVGAILYVAVGALVIALLDQALKRPRSQRSAAAQLAQQEFGP